MGTRILIIEDDPLVAKVIRQSFDQKGYTSRHAGTVAKATNIVERWRPDLTLTDHNLPDGTAFEVIEMLKRAEVHSPIVVMTGYGTIDLAVQAMKHGAENFITKPVDIDTLGTIMSRCIQEHRRQRREAADQVLAARVRQKPDPFLGTSAEIAAVRQLAEVVVESEAPVLIMGETGTGKGVLAHWLHTNGHRSCEPFVDLNCSGLSRELAESELFGHQRGSFTNASANKTGLVEVAHRGTLFLDEIGDLDLAVQPKLLKVLEDQRYRKVGDVRLRDVDIRLIAATHRALGEMTSTGAFRSDLLFRINTITFELPALRHRRQDIPLLANSIMQSLAPHIELTGSAMDALKVHDWPGNLRELRNALERAVLLCRTDRIDADLFHFGTQRCCDGTHPLTLQDVERNHIADVLLKTDGHVGAAAERLGIPRSSLYAKIKKLGLTVSQS